MCGILTPLYDLTKCAEIRTKGHVLVLYNGKAPNIQKKVVFISEKLLHNSKFEEEQHSVFFFPLWEFANMMPYIENSSHTFSTKY